MITLSLERMEHFLGLIMTLKISQIKVESDKTLASVKLSLVIAN